MAETKVEACPVCHPYQKDIALLLKRMNRLEGQVRGVRRMIEEDRYCIEIVQQLSALSAAADEVALLILQDHIEGCVTDAIREEGGTEKIEELMATLRKAIRR